MQTHESGEARQLTSHWYDEDGEGVEPSAITLTITAPNGTTTSYNKAQLTQGDTVADWFRLFAPNADGVWRYTFVGTVGGFPVEQGGTFLVGEGAGTSPTGPCEPWCDWEAVTACDSTLGTSIDLAQRELAIDLASEILFNLSGRVYTGICERTRSICSPCHFCVPSCCSCVPLNAIDLALNAPVWGVFDVSVDGVALSATAYELQQKRYLVRIDGDVWPTTGVDVTWASGRAIPLGARYAAALYAAEIVKLCIGKQCQIPQRVTNMTREGTTFTILDSMKVIAEGRTGIALVDAWLVSDKKGRRARPGMFSPMAVGSMARHVRA